MTRRHLARRALIGALTLALAACATQAPPPPALAATRRRQARDAATPGHRPAARAGRADAAAAGARAVRARHRRPVRHRPGDTSKPVLARAEIRDSIIAAMSRPAEAKPWRDYRPIFITQARIDGGQAFLATHRDELARVEAQTGVPAEIIVVDHRRRNQLRRQHRQVPGDRCAVHARVRLSAHRRSGQGRSREPPRGVLPRRAGAAVRARQGNRLRHHHADRQLRRRDGLGPVHAVELPRVRGRRRRRRPARPVHQPRRRVRLDRQLLRAQGRLGARRPGRGARQSRAPGAADFEPDALEPNYTLADLAARGYRPLSTRSRRAKPRCCSTSTASRARSTGSASATSTRSPATTSPSTTRWRCTSWPRRSPDARIRWRPARRRPRRAAAPAAMRTPRRRSPARRRMRALLLAGLVLGWPPAPAHPRSRASSAAAVARQRQVHGAPPPAGKKQSPYAPAQEDPSKRGHYQAGGLYAPHIADSTPDDIPDVDAIPEPEVTAEPRSRVGNRRSYTVLGKQYRVLDDASGYVEQGTASYYGNKFHGRRTSNLEVYDMYAFTAAHKIAAAAELRARHQPRQRQVGDRARQRPRPVPRRPRHRPELRRRGQARHHPARHRPGRGARADAGRAAAPAASRRARCRGHGAAASAAPASTPRQAGRGDADRQRRRRRTAAGRAHRHRQADAGRAPRAIAAAPARSSRPTRPRSRATVAAGTDYRFDMRQDGKAMSADEFDAWMKARQVRVATGKPAPARCTRRVRRAAAARAAAWPPRPWPPRSPAHRAMPT